MTGYRLLVLSVFAAVIVSCATSSNSLMSHNDEGYFQRGPSIITKDERCFLGWQRAKDGFQFYMYAESNIVDNKLIFNISVTTSTGNLSGKRHLQEIHNAEKKKLAVRGEAYWIEPDGTLVNLEVEKMKKGDEIYLMERERNEKIKPR